MKYALTLIVMLLALFAVGCGGSTLTTGQNDQQQIRSTEISYIQALQSKNPSSAAKYITQDSKQQFLTGIIVAKGMNVDISAQLPPDWRNHVNNTKITVTGDKAVMSSLHFSADSEPQNFVNDGGHWLLKLAK
jgi:Tfp pilus assembly protein PilP